MSSAQLRLDDVAHATAPTGLRVYRSNRLEVLFAVMLQVIERLPGQLPDDPLQPLKFTVGSAGMAQWLQHRISEHWGIASLIEAVYPERTFADALHRLEAELDPELAALTPPDEPDPWQPSVLVFTVLEVMLAGLANDEPELAPVRAYLKALSGESDSALVDAHLLGLAQQIADVFDRLITWRGALALALSQHTEPTETLAPWLAAIWRATEARILRPHAAARLARLLPRERAAGAGPLFEQPIRIFGLSALPPTALNRIALLARHTAVDLYVLCPSNAWWAELHARRDAGRRWLELPREEAERALWEDLPQGHPLLASLGRTLRDFQVRLEALQDTHGVEPVDVFVDAAVARQASSVPVSPSGLFLNPFVDPAAEQTRALAWLQSDLLHMAEPGPASARRPLRRDDTSLVFHDCAGPIRQVEALRDALLAAFEADETLTCRDIVVMCSDVETYAPLITAAFEGAQARGGIDSDSQAHPPRVALPYRLLDLSLRRGNPVADALLHLLTLVNGRLSATGLLALLELEPVRQRFRMLDDDLPKLRTWANLSAMRWGADADDRVAVGQPEDAHNTLSFGLERLLTGIALGPMGLFGDVAPVTDIVGTTEHVLLGAFAEFVAVVVQARREAGQPRTMAQWITWLVGAAGEVALQGSAEVSQSEAAGERSPTTTRSSGSDSGAAGKGAGLGQPGLIDRFTATSPGDAWWSERVRSTLLDLSKGAGPIDLVLDLAALQVLLTGQFELPGGAGQGDPAGITVSSLVPMRGQPHRVVALLGMDDGAFPRKSSRRAFDPVSAAPQMGDPSPPDEDRGALLEAILAAREQLWCFYSGRDPRTQREQPPSVVITELRDVVRLYFAPPPEAHEAADATEPLNASQWLTVVHPLQSFSEADFSARSASDASPRHVGDDQPRSFDGQLAEAVNRLRDARLAGQRDSGPPFISAEAMARLNARPMPDHVEIELGELERFFGSPLKRFLGEHLSLWSGQAEETMAEREPLEYEAADPFRPIGALLADLAAGETTEHLSRRLRAEGRLPLGRGGDRAMKQVEALTEHLRSKVLDALPEPITEVSIKLQGSQFSLAGTCTGLYDALDLRFQEKKDDPSGRPWWLVGPWIRLLARKLCGEIEPCLESVHLYLDSKKQNAPVHQRRYYATPSADHAELILKRLVGWYQTGQQRPLPWLANCGYAWAYAHAKGFAKAPLAEWDAVLDAISDGDDTAVADKVRDAWSKDGKRAEVMQVFGDACPAFEGGALRGAPFAREFMALARDVWVPIINARSISAPKPEKPSKPKSGKTRASQSTGGEQ